VTTELLRGVLSPVGHGLVDGHPRRNPVLPQRTRTHFVSTGRLVAAFVGVSVLHAPWERMPTIASRVTLLVTGTPWQYELLLHGWLAGPTGYQVRLFTVLDWCGLVVVGVVGSLWLVALVRRSRREATETRQTPTGLPHCLPGTRNPRGRHCVHSTMIQRKDVTALGVDTAVGASGRWSRRPHPAAPIACGIGVVPAASAGAGQHRHVGQALGGEDADDRRGRIGAGPQPLSH
jgi:hypothetical protein